MPAQATIDELRHSLDQISDLSNEYWMNRIDGRKTAELEFHDEHRDPAQIEQLDEDTFDKLYGNKKYYSAAAQSKNYAKSWIERESRGRVFLDYACGNGDNAILAAQSGAELAIGIDISSVSISNARDSASKAGSSQKTCFVQADAENTLLPSNSIDRIICSGVLHHLDLSYAFPEIRRILKPGGKLLAIEALDYNPAIKLYRHLTPAMRTEWEKAHILSLKDIRFGERFFKRGEVKYWHITEILSPHAPLLAPLFRSIDGVLTKIPLIQLMSWIFTFEFIKQEEE